MPASCPPDIACVPDAPAQGVQYREADVYFDGQGNRILLDSETGEIIAVRPPSGRENAAAQCAGLCSRTMSTRRSGQWSVFREPDVRDYGSEEFEAPPRNRRFPRRRVSVESLMWRARRRQPSQKPSSASRFRCRAPNPPRRPRQRPALISRPPAPPTSRFSPSPARSRPPSRSAGRFARDGAG